MKKYIIPILLSLLATAWASPNFLALSDIHLDHTAKTTNYGKDAGTDLWNSALTKASALIAANHPAFILILGDLPAHGLLNCNRSANIKTVLQSLRTKLGANAIPIYLLPGNNDSLDGNYHSFSNKEGRSLLQLDPGWPAINSGNPCAANHVPCVIDTTHFRSGYYSAYPLGSKKRLRLILLNSVIFTNGHYVSDDGISQLDAAKAEINWLAKDLADAKAHHDAVIIAMHIPPGLAYDKSLMWGNLQFNNNTLLHQFIGIISQYQSNIRLLLASHTHADEIRKIYNAKGDFVGLTVSVPSISPIHNNNPGMKIFTYNPKNFKITDVKTFYTTPTAGTWGNDNYSFNDSYHCKSKDIVACIKEKSFERLSKSMNEIYLVKNPQFSPGAAWEDIDAAIIVKDSR